MFRKIITAFLALASFAQAAPMIETSELRGFDELAESRRELISAALKTGGGVAGMPYLYGGNGAEFGGFDCSGAMYHVLRKVGLKPPRTSSDQYLWVRDHSRLHPVSIEATDTEHASFSHLKPGDLVFWSGTYEPTDGRLTKVTHVAMFLGHEKKDGRAVMINATNGRSYRGTKVDGYGVCDFRVPKKGGRSRMVGYGTPPGLAEK